jgi:hypothetical protein
LKDIMMDTNFEAVLLRKLRRIHLGTLLPVTDLTKYKLTTGSIKYLF